MTDSDFKEMLWLIKKLQTSIRQVTLSNSPHHSEYSFNPASRYGLTMQVQPPTTGIGCNLLNLIQYSVDVSEVLTP